MSKCHCTAYCGQFVLYGHCQGHPAKVAVVSFAPATVRGISGAELSDEQINKIISQHEVHEYHPGATLEFARAVIAADRAAR